MTIVTKDQLGNIVDAEEVDPDANVESCVSQVANTNRGITISVKNEKGQEISKHQLTDSRTEENEVQFWNRNNSVSI